MMLPLRSLRLLIVLLVSISLLAVAALAQGQIPSPDQYLGFHVGEDRKLADWEQVVGYYKQLAAAAPDRVRLQELGKSTLGKPFIALTITLPRNMQKLARYLEIQ